MVEVVVDRGMGGKKFLEGLHVPEPCHRPLSSSERLVGILGSIVELLTLTKRGTETAAIKLLSAYSQKRT